MVSRNGIGQNQTKPSQAPFGELRASRRMVGAVPSVGFLCCLVFLGTIPRRRPEVVLDIRGGFAEVVRTTNELRQCTAAKATTELPGHLPNGCQVIRQRFDPFPVFWVDMGNQPSSLFALRIVIHGEGIMESVKGINCSLRGIRFGRFVEWSLFRWKDSLIQQQHMFQLTSAVSGTPVAPKTGAKLLEKKRIVKKKFMCCC